MLALLSNSVEIAVTRAAIGTTSDGYYLLTVFTVNAWFRYVW